MVVWYYQRQWEIGVNRRRAANDEPRVQAMLLSLPDKSVVRLDKTTLQFHSVEPDETTDTSATASKEPPPGSTLRINFEKLAALLQTPHLRFGECFRRSSDHPSYSPKGSDEIVDLRALTHVYNFREESHGGMFSSLDRKIFFLDGFIQSHAGYGWGSHSWTIVQGAEALRAVCLFCGVQQPRAIKGERPRRPLPLILQDMTAGASLNEERLIGNGAPLWP
jgi:hypothetical protein